MSTPRRTHPALVALAWAAAVVVATLVGMSAVGAIGTGILGGGQQPLTPAEVDQALAAARSAPTPPVAAPPPVSPTPPSPAAADVVASPGGTIVARCTGGVVEIVSASPAQGFRLDDEREGARVKFESEEETVEVRLRCESGRPVGAVRLDDD
ncbi:hypothetical protein ACQPZQ_42200 [Pseudonocardia sp. CA-142604]|uniref:hypothetical protein n=1 Tax=Pseudonocardia sp. CA-142604 TaxID=3240024 RepID=UPI003D921E96